MVPPRCGHQSGREIFLCLLISPGGSGWPQLVLCRFLTGVSSKSVRAGRIRRLIHWHSLKKAFWDIKSRNEDYSREAVPTLIEALWLGSLLCFGVSDCRCALKVGIP